MRKNINGMLDFSIMAVDGKIGHVKDFYFDDETWTIRYLVVKTGSWLLGRKVLISFASVKEIDCESSSFHVDLNCDQVKNSPDIDTEKPVYRQHEMDLHDHYMLPTYWNTDPGMMNVGQMQSAVSSIDIGENMEEEEPEVSAEEKHLRSSQQVEGYLIHAVDGEIGHVKDYIFDMESGKITFFLVETRNLLSGRKVLLSTDHIGRIDWLDTEVYVDIPRGEIIESPEFDLKKDL